MLKTLIVRVQHDETLPQEEKNKRVTLLFDWWEKDGKKLVKVNKKIHKRKIKNKPPKFTHVLSQWKYYHRLKDAYYGITIQDIIKNPDIINLDSLITDDKAFINDLIAETKERYKIFPEFN